MTLKRSVAMATMLALALVVIPAPPAGASGGGGCGGPVTSAIGREIAIDGFCFTPTVLYAEPGDTITWTNEDPVTHNVVGANAAWGSFEQLRRGRSVSYSFADAGVFSYVCTLHPGMVGTVVVGDPEPGPPMAAKAVRRIKPLSARQNDPAPGPGTSDDGALWLAATAIVVVVGASLVARRLGRRAHS